MFAKSIGAKDVSFMERRKQSPKDIRSLVSSWSKGNGPLRPGRKVAGEIKVELQGKMALISTCSPEAEVETYARHRATLG